MPSEPSRLTQAADLATFLHRRRSATVETNPKQEKAISRIWAHVEGWIAYQLTTCP
ncbi:MAG: hypothetical protein QG622_2287 [Actinomycetota bacterium]|nr:hypothetical protein [Actinomycetota bacterium]